MTDIDEYFRGRVVFPIRDASTRTVAFGGRVVPGIGSPDAPKYLNSADSPLFAKNKVVFALDVARAAIVERDSCVVMEGYADCIMAHQFGVSHAVATLGTALTENHVGVLNVHRQGGAVFDGDQAGRDAAEKSLPRFLSQDVDLRILTLTTAKDPADFLTEHGAEAFYTARFGSRGLGIQATLEYRTPRSGFRRCAGASGGRDAGAVP